MDEHMDTSPDQAAPPGPAPGTTRPEAATPAEAPALDTLARGLEKRLAGLVEEGLARLGGQLEETRRQEALAAFAARHPDFAELRGSGRLDALRRDNPLLDEVGAYFAARLEHERQGMAARLEETARETEKRILEGLRVRRQAATLSPGQGAAPGAAGDPELADPVRFGGVNAVLARRLATRRSRAGN